MYSSSSSSSSSSPSSYLSGGDIRSGSFNFNIKIIFLFIILITACCLFSIGYNFNIDELFTSKLASSVCFVLILFLFYVLYETFKIDTCEELNKPGIERFGKSMGNMGSTLGNVSTSFGNMYQPSQQQPMTMQQPMPMQQPSF